MRLHTLQLTGQDRVSTRCEPVVFGGALLAVLDCHGAGIGSLFNSKFNQVQENLVPKLIKSKPFVCLSIVLLSGCDAAEKSEPVAVVSPADVTVPAINPATWPLQDPVIVRDPAVEQRVTELLRNMTLEEKVGQIIQADINSVTPAQVAEYNLGSILNGGGSAPDGDNRTTPDKWLALADEFWDASTDSSDGGLGIPALWGTDAVHGHSNILGATIFPHNIGLGMANDPALMYDIGRATALEMLATGLDWTFAPTIAVVRDDRWGRTYESYSEDPRIVAAYASRIIEGIQGVLGSEEFLGEGRMIATAKHFAGDGGTTDGRDQGDTVISEEEFREVQAASYPPAIRAGVQSVMASFNSYHGRKIHGHRELLTDVLVGRIGFDGFVVGDWNGHGQVAGCTNTSCAASINAGLDMFMAPDSWEELYVATLEQARSGEISSERLDQAVSRILRVKLRAGLFEAGRPSSRAHAGDYDLLASPAHRAVAREAVRKSLVLLKNENQVLPLRSSQKILLAGDGAHNIGKQSGGWTLNWQGTDNLNEHFPNGTSIYDGLREAMESGVGSVTLSEDGSFDEKPDVAIVVFGEDPYAEFQGDRATVDYDSEDGLQLLRELRAANVPTVSVFISGRAMWVNPEINASDAFVAAWLPGTEGAGIADLLVADDNGVPRYDFTGRLSFSWPKSAVQTAVNVGDADYDPQFAYGYGLDYATGGSVAVLAEDSGLSDTEATSTGILVAFGDPVGDWSLMLEDAGGKTRIGDSDGSSGGGLLSVVPADREVQEDTIVLTWSGDASLIIEGRAVDLVREANGDMVLQIDYQVISAASTAVSISMGQGTDRRVSLDVSSQVRAAAGEGWQTSLIRLSCFEEMGLNMASVSEPLVISSDGPMILQLASARIVANPGNVDCR